MLYKHCRICLTKTFKFSCFSNGENSIKYKMRMCVPEIDLNVISDPVLCDSCTKKLDVAYKFKLQCLNMEDKIIDYIKIMQPETLHIQLLDVIRMIIADPKGKTASNASVIELSDAEDDVTEKDRCSVAVTHVNIPEMNTNILDQTMETIHLNQVRGSIPVVQINSDQLNVNPLVDPIMVDTELIEQKVFMEIGDTCVQAPHSSGSGNFRGFVPNSGRNYILTVDNANRGGAQLNFEVINLDANAETNNDNSALKNSLQRKYNDVFQERISHYVEQNLLVNKDKAPMKTSAESDCDVIIVEDKSTPAANVNTTSKANATSNVTTTGSTTYSRGRGRRSYWRSNMHNAQSQQGSAVSNSATVSKENMQSSIGDKNKIKGHVMKDGAIIKKPFGCTKCSETFETIDRLLKHVREHKSSTVTNYTRNCRVETSKNS